MATSKKGKILLIAGGFLGLIILVGIAAWLTGHMMVLSKGVNQLIESENSQEKSSLATAAVVVKREMPPAPPPPSNVPEKPPTMPPTEAPQVTSVTNTIEESNITDVEESEAPTTMPSTTEVTTTTIPQPAETMAQAEQKADQAPESSSETPVPEKRTPMVDKSAPDKKFLYEIQVGAFLVKKNAEDRIKYLKELGYKPYMFRAADRSNRLWYTVRIGEYETVKQAAEALSLYKGRSDYPAAVTHWNSLLSAKMK